MLMYVSTFALSIHLSVDTWVVAISWLLWIVLQWTSKCRCFKILISNIFNKYWEELLWDLSVLFFIYTVVYNRCFILHSYLQCTRILIFPYPIIPFFNLNNGHTNICDLYFHVRLYFSGAPKSVQIVTAAMKLKDGYFLEEKLWPI